MDEPLSRSAKLTPKDHAEAVARFRSELVGALTRRDLARGELRAALLELSQRRFRPPGSDISAPQTLTERVMNSRVSNECHAARRSPEASE